MWWLFFIACNSMDCDLVGRVVSLRLVCVVSL